MHPLEQLVHELQLGQPLRVHQTCEPPLQQRLRHTVQTSVTTNNTCCTKTSKLIRIAKISNQHVASVSSMVSTRQSHCQRRAKDTPVPRKWIFVTVDKWCPLVDDGRSSVITSLSNDLEPSRTVSNGVPFLAGGGVIYEGCNTETRIRS